MTTNTSKKNALSSSAFVIPRPARKEVDDATAHRFLRAEHADDAANDANDANDAKEVGKGSRLRRPSQGERLAVYLPPELATALRVHCARERRSASDAVTEAVLAMLRASGVGGL